MDWSSKLVEHMANNPPFKPPCYEFEKVNKPTGKRPEGGITEGDYGSLMAVALDDEFIEVKHIEHIPKRDPNTEYNQYILYNTENIELKFDNFDKIGNENLNDGIFLYKSMTIEKFYTILYFLEYLRVKYDFTLRSCVKMIWNSLDQSKDLENLDVDKVSFHFSKQKIFSHELFKILSKVYFERFLSKEKNIYPLLFGIDNNSLEYTYEKLYTENNMQCLTLNETIASFITRIIDNGLIDKNLFILLLNTFDVKYLHIINMPPKNLQSYYFILKYIKKKIDEVVFKNVSINDELITFTGPLFIFYTGLDINKKDIITDSSVIQNLNTIKNIINNSMKGKIENWLFPVKKCIPSGINEQRNDENIYLSLFESDKFREKIKIFDPLNLKYKKWNLNGFYELNGDFYSFILTFRDFCLNRFEIKDIIVAKNIRKIEIKNSKIHIGFLKDIFCKSYINHLSIIESRIIMKENLKLKNSSHLIYKNDIILRFKNRKFYIKESYIFKISEKNFKGLPKNELSYNIIPNENNTGNYESYIGSLKLLFVKYNFGRINKLGISAFPIKKADFKAWKDLLCLRNLTLERIRFEEVCFFELFCPDEEYKIQSLDFTEISIGELVLKFISVLTQPRYLRLNNCQYFWSKFIQHIKEEFDAEKITFHQLEAHGIYILNEIQSYF
ncbi:hypothetical protein CWI38_0296p0020 [Hamiltosporidium tvaerminnensis]|uniref:Uncharacterized protein n=1 Tax=Hamiltosporidium tvaerminnensis TaxID=1176355 RepID=A0A4Q9M1I1_9MICR|nr:hypothetical protein CWI38_0296p0020 [Hamiltosporidium tvaerminnensis]